MNLIEYFPEVAKWNVDKLIVNINQARKELGKKRELSPMSECYLYGVLAEYSPKAISQKLNLKVNGSVVRTSLSTEINPYIRKILDYPDTLEGYNFWGNARRELEKAGYKKTKLSLNRDFSVIKIKLNVDNPSMSDAKNILDAIHEMTQDKSIEIQDIRRGCIELVLSGSEEGLKRLESLIKSGALRELNGIKIINVESSVEASKVVHLSNWVDNLVEFGWEGLEQFLSPRQLQFENIRSDDIRKGKLIDRTMLSDGFAVVLTLKQEPLAEDSVDIILRLYPTQEQVHLPSGITMRMFSRDEHGNQVSTTMQANSLDEWIQLHFTGKPSEEFGVEIIKGDISVVENFVI